jgi:Spy/CpxP family protein refolding chaperone
MMKSGRLWNTALALMFVMVASAQNPTKQKFSPEQFEQELRQFIIEKAALTPEETDKLFPVYQEMRKKQHALFQRQRCLGRVKPADDAGCQKAIQERDNIEVELRRLQQSYHNKFLDVMPASKVYDVLQAEDEFHRHKLKQWGGKK